MAYYPINPLLDKQGGILVARPQNIVERMEEIQEVFNLHDVWRIKNPQTKSFTWSQKSPFIFCRLGYWLFSNSLQNSIKYVDIFAAINRTDHSFLLHLQELEEKKRGI